MTTTSLDDLAFLEQALRYLDGKLGVEEARQFQRGIESDPARMRRFAALTLQRVQLAEMGRGASVAYRPRASWRRRAGVAAAMTAAAGLAVVAVVASGGGLPFRRSRGPAPGGDEALAERRVTPAAQKTPAPSARATPAGAEPGVSIVARLDGVQGDVAVVADGRRAPARAGRQLGDGEGVSVSGERSRATLRLERAGRLEVAPGTMLGAASAGVLPVAQGRIFAERRDGDTMPLTMSTPLAELRASSAVRFRLDVRPDETRVEVHKGSLRLMAFATGRSLDVGAGALATLGPERDVQVEREEPPLPVVFALQSDPRELPVVRRMPEKLLVQLRGWPVDKEGFLNPNRAGFRCAGEQRHALNGMVVGAALGNRAHIDLAWRVVDATMRFQDAEGSFLDTPVCDADFLAEVAHALIVLMESELERPYRKRINALIPRLARTAAYLSAPAHVEELKKYGIELTKAYILQGMGFAFMGILLEDSSLQGLGRTFIDLGLARQRNDGAFLQDGGIDANYQAITLGHLGPIVLRLKDPRYEAALRAGGAWFLGRITGAYELDITGGTRTGPDCKSDKCIGIDWARDAWGLLYYAVDRDPQAIETAIHLFERKKSITR